METRTLYNGTITVVLDNRHRYTANGESVPGVTSVVNILDKSAQLTSWAANLASDYWFTAIRAGSVYTPEELHEIWLGAKKAHREKKKKAADLGTDIHSCLESIFKTDLLTPELEKKMEEPRVKESVRGALDWLKAQKTEKVAVEQLVYSRKHDYAGKLDKKVLLNGKLSLLDWKTGKNVYREQVIQQAAYLFADEEESGDTIEQAVLLHIDKDTGQTEPFFFSRAQLKPAHKAFLAARSLYKHLKDVPQPNVKRKDWTDEL